MATRFLKPPPDPNGRHIRLYVSVTSSPAFRALSYAGKALYIDLISKLGETNNGNISASLSDMKHHSWNSSATLSRALYELRAAGFIAVTRAGGLRQGTRVPTLYRFTHRQASAFPHLGIDNITKETHDYLAFKSVREAERAIKERIAAFREEGIKKQFPKKTPVLKLNHNGSDTESHGMIYRFRK